MIASSPLKGSWADVMSSDGEATPSSTPKRACTSPNNLPHRELKETSLGTATRVNDQRQSDGTLEASEKSELGEQHYERSQPRGSDCSEAPCEGLSDVLEMVKCLYKARDELFSVAPTERINAIKDRQRKVLDSLDALPPRTRIVDKAMFDYIRGKALDVGEDHVSESEELLGRAVKLCPSLGDGWNQLGSCLWKKGEFELAYDCWQLTLVHSQDEDDCKAAMRELSMAHRVKGNDPNESLRLAKEVVSKDMSDTKSWYNLANAYMSHFFSVSFEQEDLSRALRAYHKAQETTSTCANPDVHYNQATVLRYLQDYQNAVEAFERADALDPLLNARESIRQVVTWVSQLYEMISKKCHLKDSRIAQMLSSIPTLPDPLMVDGRQFTSSTLAKLSEGNNTTSAVQTIIVASPDSDLPTHLIVCDGDGVFFSVSVYNIRKGMLKPGDVLTLLAPTLITCRLSAELLKRQGIEGVAQSDISYRCVQTKPTDILHNGRTCDFSYFERPRARFTVNPTTITATSPHR